MALKMHTPSGKGRLFFIMNRHLTILFLLFMTSFSYADGLESKPASAPLSTPISMLAARDGGSDGGSYLRVPEKPEVDSDNSKLFAEWHLLEGQPPTFSPKALEGAMVDLDSLKKMKRTAAEKSQGPVPESSTMLLLGLGLLGLSGFGARRKFRR
jgi:hypothetical protein